MAKLCQSTDDELAFELAFKDFADEGRVCLALAQLHHLAFEKIQRGRSAGFEICCRTGIRRNSFIAESFDFALVTDLGEAKFLNQNLRRFSRFTHSLEYCLAGGRAYLTGKLGACNIEHS